MTRAFYATVILDFLRDTFELVPTGIVNIPVATSVATDRFTWTRGDIVRLQPRRPAQVTR